MSKTYRDVVRGKLLHAQRLFRENPDNYEQVWKRYYQVKTDDGRFSFDKATVKWQLVKQIKPQLHDPWDDLTYEDQRKIFRGYKRNPSWWNRLFHTRPNRKRDRNLLRKYDVHFNAEKDAEFSQPHKPNNYYW